MTTRTLSDLVAEWLRITPRPGELREYLDAYPIHVENALGRWAGFAVDGDVYLSDALISHPERASSRWMLCVFLHEVCHAQMQRRGEDASHSQAFSTRAWALAERHGVADCIDAVYDMHETPRFESAATTAARWRVARVQAREFARGKDDPLVAIERQERRHREDFYFGGLVIAFAFFGVIAGFLAWRFGLLPDVPGVLRATWQILCDSLPARFVVGLIASLLFFFFATR